MGCGSSKVDDLPLVELCKERKDLIKAAADHRYTLASAHVSYFQALNSIGEALHRFVQEELTVVSTPSSSSKSPYSPVLTIPSSEGKPRPGGGAAGASSSSPTSLSHSLSHDDSHHLHLSSGSVSEASLEEDEEAGVRRGGGGPSSSYPPPFSDISSPNYYYMRHSAGIPSMVYESPYPGYGYANPPYGGNEGYVGVPMDSGSGYPPYSGNGGYFGDPMGSGSPPPDAPYYYYDRQMSPPRAATPPPPPPPPPPDGSGWDFLNPFGSYEQIYSRYGAVSVVSSPNSSEVREQEGIPDLEDETDPEHVKEFNKVKKVGVGGSGEKGKDSGVGTSKAPPAPVQEKDVTELSEEKEIKSSLEGSNSLSSGEASKSKGSGEVSKSKNRGDENEGKKEVSFEVETSLATEKSWPSIGTALSAQGTKDVSDVVMEIKEQFKVATGSCEEVSAMLEVGKLPYQSRNALFRGFWILFLFLHFHGLHPSEHSIRVQVH